MTEARYTFAMFVCNILINIGGCTR